MREGLSGDERAQRGGGDELAAEVLQAGLVPDVAHEAAVEAELLDALRRAVASEVYMHEQCFAY